MKKVLSFIIYFLYMLITYQVIDKLNLLTFFLLIILIPSILFAFVSSSFKLKSWNKNLYSIISAAVYCAFTYLVMYIAIDDGVIHQIIQNTNRLIEQNKNIVINNIGFNFNVSSFVMIFLFEFILVRFFVRR